MVSERFVQTSCFARAVHDCGARMVACFECRPPGIRLPSLEANEAPERPAAFRAALAAKHPIGPVGEPDDIAYAVRYLASEEAKLITGIELVIDGGYTAE